jgi:hypothetical protein
MEQIVKNIEKSPYYERAEQLARQIEKELNLKVKEMIEEKKEVVDSINQQIKLRINETKPSDNEARATHFDAQSRIFIFVSQSIPLSVLRSFAADIDALGIENIRFVFKAFPKTFLHTFLQKKANCSDEDCVVKAKITIGEGLFQRYAVNHVPAVVFDPDPTNAHDDWLLVYGVTGLQQALVMFHRESGRHELKMAANRVGRH